MPDQLWLLAQQYHEHRAANNCQWSDNVQLKSAHVRRTLNFGQTICPDKFFLPNNKKIMLRNNYFKTTST